MLIHYRRQQLCRVPLLCMYYRQEREYGFQKLKGTIVQDEKLKARNKMLFKIARLATPVE